MGIEYGQVNNYAKYGRPTLDLIFTGPKKSLNDRVGNVAVEFTRSSTATYVGSDGLIKSAAVNEARFDHDKDGNGLGLLIEEARTNLHDNSTVNALNQGILGLTQGSTSTIDPTGSTSTVETWTVDTSTGEHDGYRFYNNTYVDFSWSIFVKANGITRIQVSASQRDNSSYIEVDLTDGSIINQTNPNATVTDFGGGWFRISAHSGSRAHGPGFWLLDSNGNRSFTGNGTDGVYVWGMQLEQESGATFPTSYIPTSGSTVTRAVDTVSLTGTNFSSWYNGSQGSIFIDMKRPPVAIIANDTAYLEFFNNAGLFLSDIGTDFTVRIGTENNSIALGQPATTTDYKIASSYQSANDYKVSSNGSSVTSAITAVDFTTATELHIGRGNNAFAANWRNGPSICHFKRFTFWPTRLPDSDLQRLTE